MKVQRIEHVFVREGEDVDFEDEDQDVEALWEREKYWQAQTFTLTHKLNNMSDKNYNLSWESDPLVVTFDNIMIILCIKKIVIVKFITLFYDQERLF